MQGGGEFEVKQLNPEMRCVSLNKYVRYKKKIYIYIKDYRKEEDKNYLLYLKNVKWKLKGYN